MKVLETLKGGSLSRTEVLVEGHRKFVRKSISRYDNREYGLVRWQSQIRKLQLLNKYIPESTVSIDQIGVSENYYFYDIPYYESSINCVEALLGGESENLIANEVAILLSKMAAIDYGLTQGALSVYIAEEVRSPLTVALKVASEGILPLNKIELDIFKGAVSRAIMLIDDILHQVKDVYIRETLTHGNLTLENLLWNPASKKILMIDPYAETYCESIMGDVSQLSQSSDSGYEFISTLFTNRDFCIEKYPDVEIPYCFIKFSRALTDLITKESWYSADYLTLFRASQFTRMFPFKMINAPRQGIAFMMHGINLLEKF